jgi:hypothetical protein
VAAQATRPVDGDSHLPSLACLARADIGLPWVLSDPDDSSAIPSIPVASPSSPSAGPGFPSIQSLAPQPKQEVTITGTDDELDKFESEFPDVGEFMPKDIQVSNVFQLRLEG